MIDADTLYQKAEQAFEARHYQEALDLYQSALVFSARDPRIHFAIAQIFENGLSDDGIDLARARMAYSQMTRFEGRVKALGHLGVARTIFYSNDLGMAQEAIRHCFESISADQNSQARMLLGAIYEYWQDRPVLARKEYLAAFKRGMPWGLRYYARSLNRTGNRFLSAIVHMAATLVGPFYFFRFGERSPFG